MYLEDGRLVASPTDLVGFLACPHLTELSLAVARGQLARPAAEDPELALVQRRGLEHEAAYLAELQGRGLTVARIDTEAPTADRVTATGEAMARGVDVVYQAAFFDDGGSAVAWVGYADFLTRVERPSRLGGWSYEPEDTKLARHVRPSAVLQLCAYAELLAKVQGRDPGHLHVVLGGRRRETLRLADVAAYHRVARRRFEEAVAGTLASYPEPVAHCPVCAWRARCDEERSGDDHLSLVPGLSGEQARRITAATGVTTVAGLAASADVTVDGVGRATLQALRRQARLLVAARPAPTLPPPARPAPTLPPPVELLGGAMPGIGLGALPPPDPGDMFFDIEGDPFVGDGGRDYLFGIGWGEPDGDLGYRAFWGHDEAGEQAAFEALVDLLTERRRRHPAMHVYHYAAYEPAALGRLMGRYATREQEVDALLRGGVLVDLYRVVRQGVCVGTPSYSLKRLEALYMAPRTEAITDGGSSIVEYERWIETGDQRILDDLEAYNRVDSDSTRRLRDWLEARRPEYEARFGGPAPRPLPGDGGPPPAVAEEIAQNDGLRRELAASSAGTGDGTVAAAGLLGDLLDWHRREDKPAWWRYFDRVLHSDDHDLFRDTEAVAGLEYVGEVGHEARSTVHRYRFDPDQPHRLALHQDVLDPTTERRKQEEGNGPPGPGLLVALDPVAGTLDLRRGTASTAPHPRNLIPGKPIGTEAQRQALRRLAGSVTDHGVDGDGPYRAVRDLLLRRPPRRLDAGAEPSRPGEDLRRPGEEAAHAAVRLVAELGGGCLAVQGPPGSGKTSTAARMVVDLVGAGRTVGITATSHAVITNLLATVMACAADRGVTVRASQKAEDGQALDHPDVLRRSGNAEVVADLDAGVRLLAGTPWLFARPELDQRLDHLVVDEAGQLSLANVCAVGTAATNLVLVGDPRQLAQPSQGTHPPGAGVSALEHLLAGAATVPPDLGVFLDHTHRLHPAICAFVSEVVYDNRLESLAGCDRQAVGGLGPLAGSGLRWVPVDHTGNRVSAPEEADTVRRVVADLVGRAWHGRQGAVRTLDVADVLVVAPYNAQVALLGRMLPAGVRVGTVDRFQGQEAPVVVVSLTTSTHAEIPRGMEFLFSQQRLNVAVSRAQGLSVLVGSPALLDVPCRTVAQLRLANGLCRYVEMADTVAVDAVGRAAPAGG